MSLEWMWIWHWFDSAFSACSLSLRLSSEGRYFLGGIFSIWLNNGQGLWFLCQCLALWVSAQKSDGHVRSSPKNKHCIVQSDRVKWRDGVFLFPWHLEFVFFSPTKLEVTRRFIPCQQTPSLSNWKSCPSFSICTPWDVVLVKSTSSAAGCSDLTLLLREQELSLKLWQQLCPRRTFVKGSLISSCVWPRAPLLPASKEVSEWGCDQGKCSFTNLPGLRAGLGTCHRGTVW